MPIRSEKCFSTPEKHSQGEFYFIRFLSCENSDQFVIISIDVENAAKVSKEFPTNWNEDEPKASSKRKLCEFQSSESSKTLLTNKSQIYYPQLTFSRAFNSLATSFSYFIVSSYSYDKIQISKND